MQFLCLNCWKYCLIQLEEIINHFCHFNLMYYFKCSSLLPGTCIEHVFAEMAMKVVRDLWQDYKFARFLASAMAEKSNYLLIRVAFGWMWPNKIIFFNSILKLNHIGCWIIVLNHAAGNKSFLESGESNKSSKPFASHTQVPIPF